VTFLQPTIKIPPSLLAKKILCVAYVPAPFEPSGRIKFQGLHALAVIRVIRRHLRLGYRLRTVERTGNGFRVDLLFEAITSRRTRMVEVKSSKQIREVHRIQAALYLAHTKADEVVVSNGQADQVLSPSFIRGILQRAEVTKKFLTEEPKRAATTYTPHADACYTCENKACPFLLRTGAVPSAGMSHTG